MNIFGKDEEEPQVTNTKVMSPLKRMTLLKC